MVVLKMQQPRHRRSGPCIILWLLVCVDANVVFFCVRWGSLPPIHRQFVRPAVEADRSSRNSWSPSVIDKGGGKNFIPPPPRNEDKDPTMPSQCVTPACR